MGSRGCLLMLQLLLIILSQDHNWLWTVHMSWSGRRCPGIRAICIYREDNECKRHRDCEEQKKCCYFSCARRCINPNENPCTEPKLIKPCYHSVTRFYYNIEHKDCLIYEYNPCSDTLNHFQSQHTCRVACKAFGNDMSDAGWA